MRGMAVAPHALAAQSALGVLREGGNAIEAMVAAAATIAVVYPHMNSIGGDAFWLIHVPGETPRGIDACGAAGQRHVRLYRERASTAIPFRGGMAANTVAGTLSGWSLALDYSKDMLGGRLPLARLLADAIHYARHGIPVTRSQHDTTTAKLDGLLEPAGLRRTFLHDGDVPRIGAPFYQPRMAATLQQLATAGLDDFYRGDLARSIARDLAACGSPRDCGRPAQPPRWLAQAAVARALARHAVQPAAADAGRGIAADPRHPRRLDIGRDAIPTAPTTCTCASRR